MGCSQSQPDAVEGHGDNESLLGGSPTMNMNKMDDVAPESATNKTTSSSSTTKSKPTPSTVAVPSSSSKAASSTSATVPPKKPLSSSNAKPPTGTAAAAAAPPSPPGKKKSGKPINRAKDRVDASEESRTFRSCGVSMRYAYLSQRGHYPDDPTKANQDAYCIAENLSQIDGKHDAFFGVFDGHGQDGDGCAIFAKSHVPPALKAHLDKSTPKKTGATEITREQIQKAILKAHVDVNKNLHKNPNIDDSLSGTTAISIYFHGRKNRITIANVGDSRALLGQELATASSSHSASTSKYSNNNNTLKAFPLSRDQTPYRKDEKARIKATGARVMSLDQLEGLEPVVDGDSEQGEMELGEELDEGGDPPRVWSPDGDYPGTAFTRSIGDHLAENLGVFAEPEMLTREILPEDRIIVLASDGVFEFLTNQSVIDICAKFRDPLEACRAVVAEAYELWLQYELRTDDITMICIFLDDVRPPPIERTHSMDSTEGGSAFKAPKQKAIVSNHGTIDGAVLSTEGLRPVRKNVSKEKSKAIEKLKELGVTVRGDEVEEEEDFDWRKLATDKTEQEKMGIAEAIKASVMFRNINEEQREMIFAVMESVHVKAGTWVIRQGTYGDRFYIIDEGRFEVRIVPDDEEDETGEGGNVIHVYEGSRAMNSHPAFGELALMYSAPRSASIIAQSDGHLWALHRSAFRQVLLEAKDDRKDLKKVLGSIPYFEYLDSAGINNIATIMDERTFGRGENIINMGTKGEMVYVIKSGNCYATTMAKTGGMTRATFKAGSYFGDEIVSGNGIYDSTVMCMSTVTCWQLDVNVMNQTMGPLLKGEKK